MSEIRLTSGVLYMSQTVVVPCFGRVFVLIRAARSVASCTRSGDSDTYPLKMRAQI